MMVKTSSNLCPLTWNRNGVATLNIGLYGRSTVIGKMVDVRTKLEAGGHRFVPRDDPAGVGRRPAHDVREIRQSGTFGLVMRTVAADGVEQDVPLRLPGRDGFFRRTPGNVVAGTPLVLVGVHCTFMIAAGELRSASGPVDVRGEFSVAIREPADDVERLGAVGKRPLDGERVEVLAAVGAVGCAPANAVRGHRPGILDPAELVYLMDVHLRVEAARDPEEMREVANLPMQVFDVRRPRSKRTARLHPVCADKLDVAELPFADTFDKLLAVSRVPALQAGGDFEVLFLGGLARLDYPPNGRRVRRKRFFHEYVDTLLDSVFQLPRAKARVAGQHRHITWAQTANRLPPGVEAHESPFRRHIHLRAVLLAQDLVSTGQPVLEDVRHRHQLDRPVGRIERICRRSAAAPAAAD